MWSFNACCGVICNKTINWTMLNFKRAEFKVRHLRVLQIWLERASWNKSFPWGSWLPINDTWTSHILCWSQSLPPTQLPFRIMLPSCGCPLPRDCGSVHSAHFVCCKTWAAVRPPSSLPALSCQGVIMSSFRMPRFDWQRIYRQAKWDNEWKRES